MRVRAAFQARGVADNVVLFGAVGVELVEADGLIVNSGGGLAWWVKFQGMQIVNDDGFAVVHCGWGSSQFFGMNVPLRKGVAALRSGECRSAEGPLRRGVLGGAPRRGNA